MAKRKGQNKRTGGRPAKKHEKDTSALRQVTAAVVNPTTPTLADRLGKPIDLEDIVEYRRADGSRVRLQVEYVHVDTRMITGAPVGPDNRVPDNGVMVNATDCLRLGSPGGMDGFAEYPPRFGRLGDEVVPFDRMPRSPEGTPNRDENGVEITVGTFGIVDGPAWARVEQIVEDVILFRDAERDMGKIDGKLRYCNPSDFTCVGLPADHPLVNGPGELLEDAAKRMAKRERTILIATDHWREYRGFLVTSTDNPAEPVAFVFDDDRDVSARREAGEIAELIAADPNQCTRFTVAIDLRRTGRTGTAQPFPHWFLSMWFAPIALDGAFKPAKDDHGRLTDGEGNAFQIPFRCHAAERATLDRMFAENFKPRDLDAAHDRFIAIGEEDGDTTLHLVYRVDPA